MGQDFIVIQYICINGLGDWRTDGGWRVRSTVVEIRDSETRAKSNVQRFMGVGDSIVTICCK